MFLDRHLLPSIHSLLIKSKEKHSGLSDLISPTISLTFCEAKRTQKWARHLQGSGGVRQQWAGSPWPVTGGNVTCGLSGRVWRCQALGGRDGGVYAHLSLCLPPCLEQRSRYKLKVNQFPHQRILCHSQEGGDRGVNLGFLIFARTKISTRCQ